MWKTIRKVLRQRVLTHSGSRPYDWNQQFSENTMTYKVARVLLAVLVAALLASPVFAQDQKPDDQKPLTPAEKKAQDEAKKKAEKEKKEQDKIDKDLAKKHADVTNIGNRDINKG